MATTIKSTELVGKFEDYSNGCSFVHLTTITEPKLLKKSRTTKQTIEEVVGVSSNVVVKVSTFGAGIGYDYTKSVQNKLLKEGKSVEEYEPKESWHVPYKDSKVIRKHKSSDELYFYVTLNANNKTTSKYMNKVTGEEIPEDKLVDFLPVESAPKNQGVEEGNEVLVRTLKLNSVIRLSACGEVYNVEKV